MTDKDKNYENIKWFGGEKFSHTLKTLRAIYSYSAQHIAQKLNVSPQAYHKYENGGNMSIDNVKIICSLYGINISEIIEDTLDFNKIVNKEKKSI